MLYGVSYYPEYQPFDRLEQDVEMMRAAGINYARLADSIWTLCEPAEGQVDVSWLGPVLDALHAAGIKVVLCTPTYAIPAWFAKRYPDSMNRRLDGTPLPYGDRQNVDFTDPTYRRLTERLIRALLDAYAQHPALVGVQVDNETGGRPIATPRAFAEFVRRLEEKFGDVETVNEVWGLNYWSHRLGSFDELWAPVGNTNPGYDLEWRRYQADLVAEFLDWQARIVREYLRPDQFVTHDVVGAHGLPHADRKKIGDVVDIAAENTPHHTQDHLAHPPVGGHATYHDPDGVHGAYQLYIRGDMARASGHQNFLVTEMNPISVGGAGHTYTAYDGQWRLAAYTCISRGANAVAYWHWHSLHYGNETYSHGILNHDLEANRCYDEVARTGHELQRVGDRLTDLAPAAEVAFLYSPDSRYAMVSQPALSEPGSMRPDRRSYERIFNAFYRAYFDERAQIAVTHEVPDLAGHPVAVVPALYIADDATLDALVGYAEDGGHLVLSFRSGYADTFARARWERAPGRLRAAVGAGYNLYSNVERPIAVRADGDADLTLPADAAATAWMDELVLEGATPLVHYDHHTFHRFPAVVTHEVGRGRVTYVGTLPNAPLGREVARWVLDAAGVERAGTGLPEPVRVNRATTAGGEVLTFVSNFGHEPLEVPSPTAGTDLLSGDPVTDGQVLALDPWDVRIIDARA
ncbi:beta-galactosidase [Georgenia alba]|uniref:Beta-galactosidase n=1 Tax=Georgenia alba TaxID=2233858 RepID=A0ABW2QAE2_9MICO